MPGLKPRPISEARTNVGILTLDFAEGQNANGEKQIPYRNAKKS